MEKNKNTNQVDSQNDTQDKRKNTQDNDLTGKEKRILIICKEPKSKQEIVEILGYKTIKSIKKEMEKLLELGRLNMTIPDKPKSKNQKYVTVEETD